MPDFDSDFVAFTYALCTLLIAHATVDALCTIATLFPVQCMARLTTLYPSIFTHSYVREDPLIGRLLIYAVAAMSLVRVMAVVVPYNAPTMLLVAIMYCLETLICIYELDTGRTANADIATRGACSATFMALATATHASLSFVFLP